MLVTRQAKSVLTTGIAAIRRTFDRADTVLARLKTTVPSGDLRAEGLEAGLGVVGTDHDGLSDTDGADVHRSTSGPGKEEELDQIFWILRNQRRRYVLRYLDTTEEPVTLSGLSEQIAAWEYDKKIRQVDSQERKCVYVGMYQCHLPKMADASAISYNKPRGIIERGEQFDAFRHYLQLAD